MSKPISGLPSVNILRRMRKAGCAAGLWAFLVILFTVLSILVDNRPTPTWAKIAFEAVLASPEERPLLPKGGESDGDIPSGCSVFTVSKGDQVFLGGNDDYFDLDSYYWVDPGDSHSYGAVWVGTPDNVQQGVNEKGLAYDANGLPRVYVNPHLERIPVYGSYTSYPIQILRQSATVADVIEWVNRHQWHTHMIDQMHFADATGDAVIISAGANGEVVFTRKPPGDSYLVSTNFNVANPVNGYGYPSWRFDTAGELLGGLVNQEGALTVEGVSGVLDAVHVEDASSWTRNSMLADLPNGIVYLYYFHQFDQPVILNLAEEIASRRPGTALSNLFPETVQQEAALRYGRIQERQGRCQQFGLVWLVSVFASLVVLLMASINSRQGLTFWIPVVVILGPLGLLIWLVARRKSAIRSWQAMIVETTGDVAPVVMAFLTYLVVSLAVPGVEGSPWQLMLLIVLPPLVALVGFAGLLLSPLTSRGFLRTLRQRLPHAWVTTNLGIAGVFLLTAPLMNISMNTCSMLPLRPWSLSTWWALTVLGASVAMVLLLFYEGWATRRGFRAWSVLSSGRGQVTTASWRDHWWWILLSYLAVFGGIAAGAMIS